MKKESYNLSAPLPDIYDVPNDKYLYNPGPPKVLDLTQERDRQIMRQAINGADPDNDPAGFKIKDSELFLYPSLMSNRHLWSRKFFGNMSPQEAFDSLPEEQRAAAIYDLDLFVKKEEVWEWGSMLIKIKFPTPAESYSCENIVIPEDIVISKNTFPIKN